MSFHVAIIGGGNISATHARAAAGVPGVIVSAVQGVHAAKVAALASLYDAPWFTALDECLSVRPLDAVLIGSPSGVHADQGIAAARRGLHVLVEKPIDVTLDRADELIAAAATSGIRLGVMFQDRTEPSLAALERALAQGRLGRPLLASARVKWFRPPEYYAGSHWRGTRALDGGGALMNQGIHTVDLLGWLLGPIRRVRARTATLLHAIEVEDTATALLEFESGALATLEATTAAYPGYPRRIELSTTEGTVTIENGRVIAADLVSGDLDLVPPAAPGRGGASTAVVSDVTGHQRLVQDFVEAVAQGRDPVCSGVEARRSLAVVTAIYESAGTGQAADVRG